MSTAFLRSCSGAGERLERRIARCKGCEPTNNGVTIVAGVASAIREHREMDMKGLLMAGLSLLFLLHGEVEGRSKVRMYTRDPIVIEKLQSSGVDIAAVNRREGWLDLIVDEADRSYVESFGLQTEVIIPDLEDWWAHLFRDKRDFGPYYTYSEMVAKLDSLHNDYPEITTAKVSIGTSWEGRTIWAMKVSDNPQSDEEEPELFFNGAIHAREPIGTYICVRFIDSLLTAYGVDSAITEYVNTREFWFVPVINPDGYVYNETIPDGMWRKNKRDNDENGTFEEDYDGVDLNRNFPYMWGYDNVGSSPSPWSQTYRGPAPGSEPEIQAVMDFCIEHEFIIAVNYHSYGNYVIYPWDYDEYYTPDSLLFWEMGDSMTSYNGYTAGCAWEVLYPVNGGSDDWMYGDTSKPKIMSFVVEVGEDFWQPNQNTINEQWRENVGMDLYLTRVAERLYGPYIILVEHEVADTNGRLDPGDTTALIVTLRNQGMKGASNLEALLICEDPYIVVHDGVSSFGDLPPGESADNGYDPFVLSADPSTPDGHGVSLVLSLSGDGYADSLDFELVVGAYRGHFLVWDPDPNNSSGPLIANALESNDYSGFYTDESELGIFRDMLGNFDAVFVCAGIAPSTHVIRNGSDDAVALADYVNGGGRLYLEGGEVWYWDPRYQNGYDFSSLFGLTAIADGMGDLTTIQGQTGRFTEGMSFAYSGENSYIDRLSPTTGFGIFSNYSPSYVCGVARDGESRTVGFYLRILSCISSEFLPTSLRRASHCFLQTTIQSYFLFSSIGRIPTILTVIRLPTVSISPGVLTSPIRSYSAV